MNFECVEKIIQNKNFESCGGDGWWLNEIKMIDYEKRLTSLKRTNLKFLHFDYLEPFEGYWVSSEFEVCTDSCVDIICECCVLLRGHVVGTVHSL